MTFDKIIKIKYNVDMEKVAKFFKVSLQEYIKTENEKNYNGIILPRRATKGSAGYDFFAPFTFTIAPNESVTVATGIRAKIKNGWMLNIYPRSSLGFKYRLMLNNTVGIIDADYFNAENEGHIFIKMTNCGNAPLTIEQGKAFAQGVFVCFGITEDDCVTENRKGGFGSTDKK